MCFVVVEEARWYSLIFPKRRGLLKGWPVLAEKLCLLGVVTKEESKKGVSTANGHQISMVALENGSFVEAVKKELGKVGEAVWV